MKLSCTDWFVVASVALAAVAADCAVWVCISHTMITLPVRCLQNGLAANVAAQCATFRTLSLSALLVAYSAGQAAQSVPFLPAGIGLVESAMTATLTAAKIRAIPALAAVLLYRIISLWGVIAIAGLVWTISQRLTRSRQHAK